ncbi:HK97 gp10 family phage protein [Ectobacillus ponti]|uniref:HK97 gp10 family phage protein n=1 Tax=Ectobacillus ponti TaxID=2961894 RepID=A0AA41X6I8_9BACI|nr:HK97 gp10 family phage protein [Ectobacillus ponti]MCP8969722.1 HK97 gp10 family phage protein [Ectobacillus ponti]
MEELIRAIRQLESLPQKCVTRAARKGADIALKAAKQLAPEDTGYLRRGLIVKGEKLKKRGKKVYEITLNPAMNHIFQKETKSGKIRRRDGKTVRMGAGVYYYPASQEYGFMARNGRYIPGFHYLRKSVEQQKEQIETRVVEVLAKEIDKIK